MLLYRCKVTKHIFCEHILVYLWPNRQNTVWNIAKCNSVTFCKSFRNFPFLKKMLIQGAYRLYSYVAKSNDGTQILASYFMMNSIIQISEFYKMGRLKCHTVTLLLFLPKGSQTLWNNIEIPHNMQYKDEIYVAEGKLLIFRDSVYKDAL